MLFEITLRICGKSLTKVKVALSFVTCIIAWHSAAANLLTEIFRQFTKSLAGLVEVAPTKLGPEGPDLMTSEIIQKFLSRYPTSLMISPVKGVGGTDEGK